MTADALYKSLGTFWTQFFNDKQTIKGLTLGQAEEAIQQYITLAEAIKAYAAADCPIFQMTKWMPIIVKRSEFNKSPFVFEQNGAVFGPQPETDRFYAGQIFNWGRPKTPRQNVFVYTPQIKLGSLGVIANRIISPSFACTNGVEVYYTDGQLFFNFDIFESGDFPIADLIGENGAPVMYDADGVQTPDSFTVLWCYCAEIDTDILYNTYGRIFDIQKVSSETYKLLLENLVYLRTEGPTIENITAVILAFAGEKPVQEQQETIEDIFSDNYNHIVVTDKHVYTIPVTKTLRDIAVGDVLYSGEGISNTVEYFDNLTAPNWWNHQLKPRLCLGQNVLLGSYEGQLYFENGLQPLTISPDGVLHFPVIGTPTDVATFHAHLDTDAIADYFRITPGLLFVDGEEFLWMDGEPVAVIDGDVSSRLINPVDFLFSNFFKTGSALIKLNVLLNDSDIFDVFPRISALLPKHVWLIAAFNASLTNDTYTLSKYGQQDGSDEDGQFLTDDNYKELSKGLVIGMSPTDMPDFDSGACNGTGSQDILYINAQTLTSNYTEGLSTREVRTIALLTSAV